MFCRLCMFFEIVFSWDVNVWRHGGLEFSMINCLGWVELFCKVKSLSYSKWVDYIEPHTHIHNIHVHWICDMDPLATSQSSQIVWWCYADGGDWSVQTKFIDSKAFVEICKGVHPCTRVVASLGLAWSPHIWKLILFWFCT